MQPAERPDDRLAGLLRQSVVSRATLAEREDGLGDPPPVTRRMIRFGSRGTDVDHAQERLNAHGADPALDEDAIFGSLTRRATIDYQRGHGLDADAIIGPRTWASLDGPTVIGGASGQSQGGGGSAPAAGVLRYDTGNYDIGPPSPGMTAADFVEPIKKKQERKPQPDLGPTVHVLGATKGSDEEVFLWNVLYGLGTFKRWGTEADLVTQIGHPSQANGFTAPIGQVTMRIDGRGNATAKLVGRGPATRVGAFSTVAEATAALIKTFGFAAVLNGTGATWTVEELNIVHTGLLRLPAVDRSALRGANLVRELKIVERGEEFAGQFAHKASLAAGATTATRSSALRIADKAFAGDSRAFIGAGGATGSSPLSIETIVHEAAHAVENKALRDEQFKTLQEQGRLNGIEAEAKAARATFRQRDKLAQAKALKYTKDQLLQMKTFIETRKAATTEITKLHANMVDTEEAVVRLTRAAFIANQREQAQLRLLAKAQPKHPAAADFKTSSDAQAEWFTAAGGRARMRELLVMQRGKESAVTGTGGRARRLELFVTFVNANHIPPLTDYAARNWPRKPGEFFAEAYSLWLNDREYLQANAPRLVKWFDDGEYLK